MPSLPTDAANDNHDVREAALSSALAHLRRAVSATLPAAAFAEREGETLRAGASCCVVRRRCRHGLGVDLDHQHLAIIRGRRLQLEEGLRVRAEAQHRWLDDLRRGRVRKLTCSADASSSTLRTDDKSSCSRHSRSSASLTRVVVTSPFLVRLTGDILASAGGPWVLVRVPTPGSLGFPALSSPNSSGPPRRPGPEPGCTQLENRIVRAGTKNAERGLGTKGQR